MKIIIKHPQISDIEKILLENRGIESDNNSFFSPLVEHLHDPFLLPDMAEAIERILRAKKEQERVVIFGDYDVDGVSGTAILVRFLAEIGIAVSYRLPHRVHDGYGLKKYFFDELSSKKVSLVITVDCGTRDIEAVSYAKTLGIDVIVTDHHAVPEKIPKGVPVINPKRTDSKYPFSSLAGAGVAFKLIHGLLIKIAQNGESEGGKLSESDESKKQTSYANEFLSPSGAFGTFQSGKVHQNFINETLIKYIDLASLGTVSDCMPLIGENRVITTLGLKQMKNSESVGLRNFLEESNSIEGNADIIGFQIGPRINAAGRMDTPLTALRWLLASEDRCDEFLTEIEELNTRRQQVVKRFTENALTEVNPEKGILFFRHGELEHGIIGLIAGKLTEAYNRPSIVLCESHGNREYERNIRTQEMMKTINGGSGVGTGHKSMEEETTKTTLVASCRSPEWCNLVELLDECKDFFIRYGGHRQAAGFTIETARFAEFERYIADIFAKRYSLENLPERTLTVESVLDPKLANLETLNIIQQFRPFGIGNPKPLWLLESVTITEQKSLGAEGKHCSLRIAENPELKLLLWNAEEKKSLLTPGNIVSLVIELEENEWNGKQYIQGIIREIQE